MKKSFVLAILAAVMAAPAFADDTGAYVALNYGRATASGNLVTGLNTHSDSSLGLTGGYQFSKNFAAEVQFIDFGDLIQGSFRAVADGFILSAVGLLPVNKKFSVFARLGYARTAVTLTTATVSHIDTKSDITYGVGAQYSITEAVRARIGLDSYKVGQETPYGTNGTYQVASASVIYKF